MEEIEYLYERINPDFKNGILIWKEHSSLPKSWNTRYAGKEALKTIDSSGYKRGIINYNQYYAHNIIWLMFTKLPIPENYVIDHKNGIRKDNKITNLRLATRSQNSINQKIRENNTSGYKGVSFYKNYNKWESYINIEGKRTKLGYFDTPEKAYEAYCKASLTIHKDFGRIND